MMTLNMNANDFATDLIRDYGFRFYFSGKICKSKKSESNGKVVTITAHKSDVKVTIYRWVYVGDEVFEETEEHILNPFQAYQFLSRAGWLD